MQDGRVALVNPAYQRLVGAASIEAVQGREAGSNLAPEWREIALKRAHCVVEDGRTAAPMEQEMLRDDQTRVPVEVTTIPFVYDGPPRHPVHPA